MTFPLQHGVTLGLLITLAGLSSRRRLGLCWSFVAYAAAVLVCGNLVALNPERFYTPEFWRLKQALYDATKVAVALELAWRMVRAFPGAKRASRPWVVALLALCTLLAMTAPAGGYATMAQWQPRIVLGVVWLLGLTAVVAIYYSLPIRAWHRALLLGFSGYLMAFAVILQGLHLDGWSASAFMGRLDGTAYMVLTWFLAWSAWRPERLPASVPRAVLRRLQMEVA